VLRNLSAWHLLVVAGIVVLLFGSNKLPDFARGVGQSLKILKSEVKDLADDGKPSPVAPIAPVEPVVSETAPVAATVATPVVADAPALTKPAA